MSPDGPSYPPDASAQTFLLTVRGTPVPATVEEARTVHNATAGAPPSVAGAQALGDLSHNVFVDASNGAGGDLLFIDYWNSLSGLGRFFTDPAVQESAGQLFSTREGTVWSGTDTFGDFHLAAPSGRSTAGVGVLRVRVTAIEEAAPAFAAYSAATINTARRHGIVSHATWARVPDPGAEPVAEVIGIDQWLDPEAMARFYALRLGFDHVARCSRASRRPRAGARRRATGRSGRRRGRADRRVRAREGLWRWSHQRYTQRSACPGGAMSRRVACCPRKPLDGEARRSLKTQQRAHSAVSTTVECPGPTDRPRAGRQAISVERRGPRGVQRAPSVATRQLFGSTSRRV